jgi:Fic family protein
MVAIVKRKRGKKTYYYLQHGIRRGGRRQKETYLGTAIPKNIEEIKAKFLMEFYDKEWLPKLEIIHNNYAKSKKKLPQSIIEKELETFSINFTYNTQRIEGSTLTLKETADLLHDGISPRKPVQDTIEAQEHQNVFFEMLKYKKDLSLEIVCTWHTKLFEKTKKDIAGKIRDFDVRIRGSKFIPPPPRALSILLKGFFKWYNDNKTKLNAVELASLVHLKLVTIHPFGDGNGRISRLMMNFVLNKHGYPMLDIDYADRRSYYNSLERSQVTQNDVIFLQWFMKRYIKIHS